MKTESGRQWVARAAVQPDPEQPRKRFDAARLQELAASFGGQAEGIVQDLLVRADPQAAGQWILIDGERRWRAAKLAKVDRVPVRVCAPADVLQTQMVCALQRENLSDLEEAAAAQRLLEQRRQANPKYTVADLGAELGRQRANMYEVLALTRISPPVRAALEQGELSASGARLFALVAPGQQGALLKSIIERSRYGREVGVRELRELIERDFSQALKDAPWPLTATAPGWASPCVTCPKRSGNIEGWQGGPMVCTDVGCYRGKQQDWSEQVLAEARAKQEPILSREAYCKIQFSAGQFGDRVPADPKRRTWGQLAEGIVQPKLTVDAKGHALRVFTPADLEVIQKAHQLTRRAEGGDSRGKAEQAALRRKRAALAGGLALAAPRILEKLSLPGGVDTRAWRPLAEAVLEKLSYQELPLAAEYLGVEERGSGNPHGNLRTALAGANAAACVRFVVGLLLLSRADDGNYQKPDWNPLLRQAAKLAGVHLEIQNAKLKSQNEKASKRSRKS